MGPDLALHIRSVIFLFPWCMFFLQLPFSTGGLTGGELTLSDKDGEPKVHSIPDSSLVNEGGSVLLGCRLSDCPLAASLCY